MYEDYPFLSFLPNLIVSDKEKPTGILDRDGNMIYKTGNPIGFGRKKEHKYRI